MVERRRAWLVPRLAGSVEKTQVDFPRAVWINEAGDELIEMYTIPNMAHGTPLEIGEAEGACGAPGPFLLPVGISSSYHIAKFFGIAVARTSAERTVAKLSPAPIASRLQSRCWKVKCSTRMTSEAGSKNRCRPSLTSKQ